jgi:hypothetical protein
MNPRFRIKGKITGCLAQNIVKIEHTAKFVRNTGKFYVASLSMIFLNLG